jgi:hypothetical protein
MIYIAQYVQEATKILEQIDQLDVERILDLFAQTKEHGGASSF